MIKFRAWDKKTKTMYEVKSIVFTLQSMLCVNKKAVYPERTLYLDDDDTILMQYTGLKDKNGVEIFEGDIVNACGYDSDQGRIYKTTDFTGVIVYRKNSFCLQFGDFLDSWWANDEEVEVIGNIYENPELIESMEE